jgi:hypothetical protein
MLKTILDAIHFIYGEVLNFGECWEVVMGRCSLLVHGIQNLIHGFKFMCSGM